MKSEIVFGSFERRKVGKYPWKVRLENCLSDHRFCKLLRRLLSSMSIRSRLHSLDIQIISGLESGAKGGFKQAAGRSL